MISGILPHIWLKCDAQEAADFYVDIFNDSRIISSTCLTGPNGSPVKIVTLKLNGLDLMLFSAEAPFSLNDSFSLVVACHTQEEIDYYWSALTANGGREVMCGWLKDRFGLSWQVVPDFIDEMMADVDKERLARVSEVVFKSVKFNLAELQAAYNNFN